MSGGAHEEFDRLAVGWELHALEPEDEQSFATHLPGCSSCALTVEETRTVLAGLAAVLPTEKPPSGSGVRLRAAVAARDRDGGRHRATSPLHTGVAPEVSEPRGRARRRSATVLAAAALAVVVLVAWAGVLLGDRRALEDAVADRDRVMSVLLEPGGVRVAELRGRDGHVATVVLRDERLDLVSRGLAANDTRDSTYVLWAVGGGSPRSLGAFDVPRSQPAVQTVGSGTTGLAEISGLRISLEPGRSAPSTPTDVVATGEVTW
jgi:Anti-sigma-K factor rskA